MGISKKYRKSRGRKFRGRKSRKSKSTLRKHYRRGGAVARIEKDNFETGLEIGKFYIFYDSGSRALFCGKLLRYSRNSRGSITITVNNFTDFRDNITEPPSEVLNILISPSVIYPVSYAIKNDGSCIPTTPTASELPTPPSNPFMPPPPP